MIYVMIYNKEAVYAATLKSVSAATSGLLIALGVALSYFPGPIPVGPAYLFPYQSMINVLAGVLLGPYYAAFVAFSVGAIRIGMGTGTFFSLPGGIPGALFVGFSYRLTHRYLSAFAEIPGTALVGSFLSAYVVTPLQGHGGSWSTFIYLFTPAAVAGSVIGYLIVVALDRRHVLERIGLRAS